MIRRPLWLGTGVALGVAGTLWAEQRVRRAVQDVQDRLAPDHVARAMARSAQDLPQRLRAATMAASAAAVEERRRHQDQPTDVSTPTRARRRPAHARRDVDTIRRVG